MSVALKKRYEAILDWEYRRAKQIAFAVIKPKPLSVWEVMIPIVFIMGYMKAKQDREVFAQNLMFTRKTALQAAYDMLRGRLDRQSVMGEIEARTGQLLTSVPDGVYSDDIRRTQLAEVELLLDHYLLLLQAAEGQDYSGWARAAYGGRASYDEFLEKLAAAERNVNQAACRTLGARVDTALLSRIEAATDGHRAVESEKIFSLMGSADQADSQERLKREDAP